MIRFSTLNCFGLLAALAAGIPLLGADAGPLRVGAAHVDVTPAPVPGVPIRDHLYVSAIVMDNGVTRAALIGADQGGLGEAIWSTAAKRIAAELKCPVENIIVSATHTHSSGASPETSSGGGGRRGAVGDTPAAAGRAGRGGQEANTGLADKIVEAVRQANSKLQAARVGYGTGLLFLNVNRDAVHPVTHNWYQGQNLDGASDKTVAVIKFESPAGEPIAFYVNYAMHPIDYYQAGIVSADFPGQLSRWVEARYEGKAVVVFSQGASGNQNPLYIQPRMEQRGAQQGFAEFNWELLAGTWDGAPDGTPKPVAAKVDPAAVDKATTALDRFITAEGAIMGEEVLRVAHYTTRTVDHVRIWGGQKDLTCPGRIRTDRGREGMEGTYQDGPPVKLRVGVLTIGGIAFATVNGEVYNEISQRLKKESPFADTVMVTLANGAANSGYIPDDASFSHKSFQVLSSRLKAGCAESGIVNTAVELMYESLDR